MPTYRKNLLQILAAEPGVDVVNPGDMEEAAAAVQEHRPDVLIFSTGLPGGPAGGGGPENLARPAGAPREGVDVSGLAQSIA